jgi:glycosyltransferase involved in cell wall biosynthesis
MNVHFVSPPQALQKGGIENAIEGLREALQGAGVVVMDGADPDDPKSIHHFHGLWNPAHSRVAAALRRAGRPYVVSPHGMLEPWALRNRRWKKLPYFHLIERRFLMKAAALFVTSTMEKEHVLRILPHPKVEVLPLGCRDPQQPDRAKARDSLGWSNDERIMLYLSRIDPKKGLHLLFDALVGLPDVARTWKLVIVGDGPPDYLCELKQQQKRLGRALPEIDWDGALWGHARWPYLQAADLFVLPTHSENFGIAVLEALHVGTPVLTTDETPWREHSHHEGIYITKPEVSSILDGLAIATVRMEGVWAEEDREALAAWADANFAWENLVSDYLCAYKSVLEKVTLS